jgi:hypothetical protein
MRPQIFDVENFNTCALGGTHDVGELRQFASREYVSVQEHRTGVVARVLRAGDAVIQQEPVRLEQMRERSEVLLQPMATDMLVHANRWQIRNPNDKCSGA